MKESTHTILLILAALAFCGIIHLINKFIGAWASAAFVLLLIIVLTIIYKRRK